MIQRALILIVLGFTQTAHSAPEGYEECRRGKDMLGSILDQNDVILETNEEMVLRSGSTYLKRAGWWRKYWGTAVYVTLDHPGSQQLLKEGTQIPLRLITKLGGGDDGSALLSSLILFHVENDDASGIDLITINAQPYSNIPVRRFEKTVRGTLYCRAKN